MWPLGVCMVVSLVSQSIWAADYNTFPDGFLFGAATAAYQVEGAWNANGKGENIWDHMVHTHPEWIEDNSNADDTSNSYYHYDEDIAALKEVGFHFYRFSIAWSRVLPKGDTSYINQDGIDYYNNLINGLLADNIQPMVTMYHWDLPQALQNVGGWVNDTMIDYFEQYARLLFTTYGDRVKWWMTFNEPGVFTYGYATSTSTPPTVNLPNGDYLASHVVLKAHARAYHVYDDEFRSTQNGKISIALNSNYMYPKTDSDDDVYAATVAMQFNLGWYAHPIFSTDGDYPAVMKERVAASSTAQGLTSSRLPEFGDTWVNYIKGTHDFFGLNHYTSSLASLGADGTVGTKYYDMGVTLGIDPTWQTSAASWLYYCPWGMRKILNWISKEYNNVSIIITENGWADEGGLQDDFRTTYFYNYLAEMLKAINIDKNSVIGYTVWSIIDNWEWTLGYTVKLGLYQVDFSDFNRGRTAKNSASTMSSIIKGWSIPEEYFTAGD
uniref:Beta-glucosidase n=1 Tax=Timema genevievae TaxID=629358 RepID=A0A7R9PLI9_TIMGE|nr:unnamed protein product [Timema genevievae]